jgi:hypothetical protein
MLTFGNMDAIISTTKHRLESDDSKILLHGGWAHKNVLFHMLFAIMTGDAVILTSMLHDPTEVAIIDRKKNGQYYLRYSFRIATPRYLQTFLRYLPLTAYLLPTRAVVLNVMPLTPAGKTD